MKTKQILFTAPGITELMERELPELKPHEVLAKTEYSVVSGGTERANLIGMPNAGSNHFPKALGYCSIGRVVEIGEKVTGVQPGDRLLVYHGKHAAYNIRDEEEITKVVDDSINSLDAAFVIIASMGLGGVRKLELELGESAMVMGLGLLGMFSVQFCAHNFVRPKVESYPHHWTHQDDCRAILKLITARRVQVRPIVSRVVSPEEAPAVFKELAEDPRFPIGTVFDWRNL